MSKTADIEFEIKVALRSGPKTLDGLEAGDRFAWLDDRRWLGVALGHMVRDGRVQADCDWDHHSHSGNCTISLAEGAR